jgi:hypothetical protein
MPQLASEKNLNPLPFELQEIYSTRFSTKTSPNKLGEYIKRDFFELKQSPGLAEYSNSCRGKNQVIPCFNPFCSQNRPNFLSTSLMQHPAQHFLPYFNCPYPQIIPHPGKNFIQFSTNGSYSPHYNLANHHANLCSNPFNEISHENFLISSQDVKYKYKTSLLAKSEDNQIENIKDLSLTKMHKKLSCEILLEGKACKRRNVHKSIIRHMDFCVMKNNQRMTYILARAGYTQSDIEYAYLKVKEYHNSQREKGFKRMAQSIVRNIVAKKNIYTFILRETLREWLEKLEEGKVGRITKEYLSIYKNTLTTFYMESIKVLSEHN